MALASLMAFGGAASARDPQQPAPPSQSEEGAKPAAPAPKKTVPSRYKTHLPESASQYYALQWGVDSLSARTVESGELIRFTYRVVDVTKAQTLNEKKNEPSMTCPRAGAKLVIPSLEKVGKLRQTGTLEAGKVYWMAFSNNGRLVKPGDYVNVVIGGFHVEGLVVQ
ncbi:MAG TPA: hypothetical protein VMJ35_14120 [Dongiaceae bacterium]|nr:hypothetical protein [Dongiaceae bacterium]